MNLTEALEILVPAQRAMTLDPTAQAVLARHRRLLGAAIEAVCAGIDHDAPEWLDEANRRAEAGELRLEDLDRVTGLVADSMSRGEKTTKALTVSQLTAELGMEDWKP